MPRRTMLAATLDDSQLTESLFSRGPLLIQPKYDGIRCQIERGVVYSGRNGKLLPNESVQSFARHVFNQSHLDGEMVVRASYKSLRLLDFADSLLPNGARIPGIESSLMSRGGYPDFLYIVFDDLAYPSSSYAARFARAKQQVDSKLSESGSHLELIDSHACYNMADYNKWKECFLSEPYLHEGVCSRLWSGHYKEGRSTFNERLLLKDKAFTDDEAYVTGVEQYYSNENEAETNKTTGLLERSTHQAGLVTKELMGALVCHSAKFNESFKVGTGYTALLREWVWQHKQQVIGRKITYKYQPHGTRDRPRSPVFRRFRNSD